MKIAVLGVTGMLGHKVFQTLQNQFSVQGIAKRDVTCPPFKKVAFLQGHDVTTGIDVTDFPSLNHYLENTRPDYVINCIGVIKQKPDAHLAIPSITINSLLPHKLSALIGGWGGHLIHFSTDCVFNGRRGHYSEEDEPDATDLYGKSKSLGEVAYENSLTLRTSMIGRELDAHKSLLDWFLSQNHKRVHGFTKALFSGLTTLQLSSVVVSILQEHPGLHGLYQVVADPISKYDLLVLLREAYHLDIEIVPDDHEVCDRTLQGDKFHQATGYVSPSWNELVSSLVDDPTPYDEWLIWNPMRN